MPSELHLRGPPPGSLLGFLSVLGLLRSLDVAEPGWKSKVSWKSRSPYLHTDTLSTEQDVAEAAAQGIKKLGSGMNFPDPNPNVDADKFKEWQKTIDTEVIGAIGSDACLKKDKDAVETTPLCMMFGSGHQEFLTRLGVATAVEEEDRQDVQGEVHKALFSRWRYTDTIPKIALRWDPTEYHPAALLSKDPKKEPIYTVNGANRLAAVGFTAYQCVPTRRGLSAVSCMKGIARSDFVLWPVWSPPLSLAAVRIILRHPYVKRVASGKADLQARLALKTYGIDVVMKAELFWDGKFKNVRLAVPVTV